MQKKIVVFGMLSLFLLTSITLVTAETKEAGDSQIPYKPPTEPSGICTLKVSCYSKGPGNGIWFWAPLEKILLEDIGSGGTKTGYTNLFGNCYFRGLSFGHDYRVSMDRFPDEFQKIENLWLYQNIRFYIS